MIKYWLPMFYSAGSYNYANECMELLHNVIHDWPKDYGMVAFNGMLVNPSGSPNGFKESDIRVEHLNDNIKERAHGANATPEVLEKVTPAIGHVKQLTDQLFEDLGVERQNQRHAKVLQNRDVQIATLYLQKEDIFNFSKDKPSLHSVVDLYRSGIQRLAGKDGGHAKHLARHILRLRCRHKNEGHSFELTPSDSEFERDLQHRAERELVTATDTANAPYTARSESDELMDFVIQSEQDIGSIVDWD